MYTQTIIGPFNAEETIPIVAPTGCKCVQIGIEHPNTVSIRNATGIGERANREMDFSPTPVLTPTMIASPMSSFIIRENNVFDENHNTFFINENDILEFSNTESVTSITIIPQQKCDEYTIITAGYKEIGG